VRWGESLYCIGRAYGVYPWSIAEKNGIWWPYWVFPGQVLTIPNIAWPNTPAGPVCSRQFSPTAAPPTLTPTPSATSSGPILTPTPTSAVSCRAYHVVRSGDTLYRIGLTYGVPYMDIARANNLANPRLIYVGQRLCIP
jgi:LysM repeat protein